MDLSVVGRHALFFDDDGAAAFVNSKDALVEWNSLSIDRYDVRHLLSDPPSSFRRQHHRNRADSDLEAELDLERYADLKESSSSRPEPDGAAADNEASSQYSAVPFSYGSTVDSNVQKTAELELQSSGFRPPFPVPEGLLQHLMLPPTEKMHQIISRTATFVREHGGQSEIVLRVKQGDNPTFGFLMPHHLLHPYFRYLVDHQELLKVGINANSQRDTTEQANGVAAGGALSLLGSVYGSAEDDEAPAGDFMEPNQTTSSGTTSDAHAANSNHMEQPDGAGKVSQKDETMFKVPGAFKDKATLQSTSRVNTTVKPVISRGKRKEGGTVISSSTTAEKEIASGASSMPKVEPTLTEPPSDLKRTIERVAELVLKNGKEFEANIVEQDKQHGRFEFLLPSNQYHPYYLKVLRMNQESKNTIKSGNSDKDALSWLVIDKKTPANEGDSMSQEPAFQDMPLEYDRKEKFKMFIGKSKKESVVDQPKGPEQQYRVSLDAAATAAILQAATRGIKYTNLDILSKLPSRGANHLVGEDSVTSGSVDSRAEGSAQKENEAAHTGVDSAEAGMTKEQKLKAERLKRAKMFAAMIKSGAAAPGKEPLRGLSMEPPEPMMSVSCEDSVTQEVTRGKGLLLSLDGDSNKGEKLERKDSEDEREHELKKRRRHRSRRRDEDEGEDEEEEVETDLSPSRKKHRSHQSSDHRTDHSKDRHKHRERHSSSKSRESRRRHKDNSSSEDEDTHRRKKHDGSDEDRRWNHRHKNSKSSKDGKRRRKSSSRHDISSGEDDRRHKHDESSDEACDHRHRNRLEDSKSDENGRHRRPTKRTKDHHSDEPELEEGEISAKSSNQSLPSTGNAGVSDQTAPSLPPETTEVSDDLRAKIRAMLLATL